MLYLFMCVIDLSIFRSREILHNIVLFIFYLLSLFVLYCLLICVCNGNTIFVYWNFSQWVYYLLNVVSYILTLLANLPKVYFSSSTSPVVTDIQWKKLCKIFFYFWLHLFITHFDFFFLLFGHKYLNYLPLRTWYSLLIFGHP